MNPAAVLNLLNGLRRKGVRIEAIGGRLRVSAPKGTVGPSTLTALRAHKADLIAQLEFESNNLGRSADRSVSSGPGFSTLEVRHLLSIPGLIENDLAILECLKTEFDAELICADLPDSRHEYIQQQVDADPAPADLDHVEKTSPETDQTARQLLSELRLRGCQIEACDSQLLVEMLRAPLWESARHDLLADPALSDLERELLRLTTGGFDDACVGMDVRLDDRPETLWLVASDDELRKLMDSGIQRGHIWTKSEADDLFRVFDRNDDTTLAVARVKALLNAELVGWEEAKRRPHHDGGHSCPSTLFWRSIYGVKICARCHPPAAPHLVAEWIDEAGRNDDDTAAADRFLDRVSPTGSHCPCIEPKARGRLDTWVVFRTSNGTLDAHHLSLAHLIDPKTIVLRVDTRDGATAIRIATTQLSRGP
jgi:hypothetical protein